MTAQADTDFQRYANAAKTALTFLDLKKICVQFFSKNRIEMMSYHHLPPVGAIDRQHSVEIGSFGFPESWVTEYIKNNYHKVDPMTRLALSRTRPFHWSQAREIEALTEEENQYLFRRAKLVKGDGLAMPLYGPHGRNGYAGLGFGDAADVTFTYYEITRLHWATQLGHQRYCELLVKKSPEEVKLSIREKEILERVAFGDSSSDIAHALQISRNTVDTYMRRLYVKLDVSDRVTAALRGLAIGVVV